jgi:hypothetical protein
MNQYKVQIELFNKTATEKQGKLVTIVKLKTFRSEVKMKRYVAKVKNLTTLLTLKVNGEILINKEREI